MAETVFTDPFTRTESGEWGRHVVPAWTCEGREPSCYQVSGTTARHVVSGVGGATCRSMLDMGLTNSDTYFTVSVPQVSRGVAAQAGWIVREDGHNSNFYIFRVLFFTTPDVELRISRRINGVETTIANPSGMQATYGAGTKVHVRAQASGTTLRMKCWTSGSEPGWQVQCTDSTFTGPGRMGFRSALATGWTGAVPMAFTYESLRVDS